MSNSIYSYSLMRTHDSSHTLSSIVATRKRKVVIAMVLVSIWMMWMMILR